MTGTKYLVAALGTATLLLSGCSQADQLSEPPLNTVSEAPETSLEPVTETVTTAPDRNAEQDRDDKKCASLPKDPHEQYPDGSQPGRMPATSGSGRNFWIGQRGVENRYDPCATVSWIIFRGGLGDSEGPAFTGASMTNGIAFYIHGEPVQDMALFTSVENVERLDDDTVSFTWGERTRSTADGITAHYTVELNAEGNQMVAVSGDVSEFNRMWPGEQYMLGHYD